MSDLTDLVPPLGLCKKIPQGEFKYAVFEWHVSEPLYNGARISCSVHFKCCPLTGVKQYPAPTLQELLIALPDWSELSVDFVNPQITLKLKKGMIKAAPAEVLKLWLKLKGIEDGE